VTKAEQILRTVHNLYRAGHEELTQDVIRANLGLSHKMWHGGYSNTFQAMCSNSGKGVSLRRDYQNVFEKVRHGCYQLTDYGLTLFRDTSNTSVTRMLREQVAA